jgi:hypothetical protein
MILKQILSLTAICILTACSSTPGPYPEQGIASPEQGIGFPKQEIGYPEQGIAYPQQSDKPTKVEEDDDL